jgi:hypothetical protein
MVDRLFGYNSIIPSQPLKSRLACTNVMPNNLIMKSKRCSLSRFFGTRSCLIWKNLVVELINQRGELLTNKNLLLIEHYSLIPPQLNLGLLRPILE